MGSSGRPAARLEYGFLCMLLIGVLSSSVLFLSQCAVPRPMEYPGITVDRLSALLTLLVSLVGAVTFRFSQRYLRGEAEQPRFLRWLFFTVAAAYLLMLSTHLWLLLGAWLAVSIGLHQLLTYYRNRPEALRAARKKFVISRIGDVVLLAAICLIGIHWGTWQVRVFLGRSAGETGPIVTLVGLLLVIAALTKSAQFPLHSWLPDTTEAPTPVSALMHAGIVNGGGALLLRFAPFIARDSPALLLLSVIGTISATLGMLTMWAQPSAKRTLAWSTVSQMGFMMAECGTGAFAAAALHVVGHGFYKAWSFLRVGDVPQPVQGTALQPRQSLALCALGSLFGLAATAYFSLKRGLDPLRTPAEMALILMLALSIGQIWVGCWSAAPAGPRRNPMAWMAALALSLAVAVVAVPVYGGAIAFFAPVFGVVPAGDSALSWVAALLPIVALAGLSVVHALLPLLYETQSGRAFCVHVLNGFYVGTIADRVVSGPWENKGQRNGLLEKMNRA